MNTSIDRRAARASGAARALRRLMVPLCIGAMVPGAAQFLWGEPAHAQAAASSVLIPAPPGNAQQDLHQTDRAVDPSTGHSLGSELNKSLEG